MTGRKRLWIRYLAVFGGLAGLALLAAALLPIHGPSRNQEPLLKGATVDASVLSILERACADCHSERTKYPWYTALPWVFRTISEDVAKGREQLNLSRWTEYSRLRRQRALTGIANQVKDRAMPLPKYLLLHPSAKLSDAEVEAVFQWAQQERLRLILGGDAANHP